MGIHDNGYKHLFSFPAMVKELLIGFVREEWVNMLDFDSLERKNGSYVSDDLREREDDIIWKVKWRGENEWMYVYLLIEFQTEHDPFMAVRIMNYLSLLYQDLIKGGEIHSGDRLPPVLPMVIYRGDYRWKSPLNVKQLIKTPPPGLSRYLPSLRFLLLEEVCMDDAALEEMVNMAAAIFRIEKSDSLKASIPPLLSLLKWTRTAGAQQDSLRRTVIAWYRRAQMPAKIIQEEDAIFDMALEEIEPMLSERIEQWSKELRQQGKAEGMAEGKAEGMAEGKAEGMAEGKAEGIAEGKAEGVAEGKAELFLSLYQKKFGSIPEALKKQLFNATAEEIQQLSERLLFANIPEDIFF